MTEPNYAHGKICYLIIPARDPQESAAFFAAVFNWQIRSHDDGTVAFDDPVGGVSGVWLAGREPADNPGTEIHIMVSDADAVEQDIVTNGGSLVWRADAGTPEIFGTFRDPSGNLFGYYQQAGLSGQ